MEAGSQCKASAALPAVKKPPIRTEWAPQSVGTPSQSNTNHPAWGYQSCVAEDSAVLRCDCVRLSTRLKGFELYGLLYPWAWKHPVTLKRRVPLTQWHCHKPLHSHPENKQFPTPTAVEPRWSAAPTLTLQPYRPYLLQTITKLVRKQTVRYNRSAVRTTNRKDDAPVRTQWALWRHMGVNVQVMCKICQNGAEITERETKELESLPSWAGAN